MNSGSLLRFTLPPRTPARWWSRLSTRSFSFVLIHFPFSTEPWSFERKGSWCSLVAKKHFVPKLMECKYSKCNQACEVPKITQFPVPFAAMLSKGHVRSSPALWLVVKTTSWAMKKNLGFLEYIGNAILPSYVGIIVHHYRIPINQPGFNAQLGFQADPCDTTAALDDLGWLQKQHGLFLGVGPWSTFGKKQVKIWHIYIQIAVCKWVDILHLNDW